MRVLQVQPYHFEVRESKIDDEFSELRIWCSDAENQRALLRIRDFPNTVYIQLPATTTDGEEFKWTNAEVDVFSQYLQFAMGEHKPVKAVGRMRKPLYFYQAHKSPFLEVQFKNEMGVRHCSALLRKPRVVKRLNRAFQFALHEGDICLERKFCTARNITFTDWLAVSGADCEPVNKVVIGAETQELVVPASCVSRSPDQTHTTALKIMSFDIEVNSESGEFPVAYKEKDEVFLISCVFWRYMQPETMVKYRICTAALRDSPGVVTISADNELAMFKEYARLVSAEDPSVITGYNILGFDLLYMQTRVAVAGQSFPKHGVTYEDSCTEAVKIYNRFYGDAMYIESSGRICVDVMHQVINDVPKMRSYKLNYIGELFLNEKKHDVTPQYMFSIFQKSRESDQTDAMTVIAEYCDQDALLVARLFDKLMMQTAIISRAAALGVNPVTIPSGSSEHRCISLLYNLAHNMGYVLTHRPSKYEGAEYVEGGYVSEPMKGTWKDVACSDFNSLYPSIMQWKNICFTTLDKNSLLSDADVNTTSFVQTETSAPDTTTNATSVIRVETKFGARAAPYSLPPPRLAPQTKAPASTKVAYSYRWASQSVCRGIMPELVRELVEKRKEAKQQIKAAKTDIERAVADQRQLGFKIAANSLYGFLAMVHHGRYSLIEGAQSICGTGRNSIIQCGRYMQDKYGCDLIYGDTDSIMYKYPGNPTTKEVIALATKHSAEMSALFGAPMNIELEKTMFMISRKKKNYAYICASAESGEYNLDDASKVEIKGMVPTRRDNTKFTTAVFMDVLMARYRDKNMWEVFCIVRDYAHRLVSGQIPISDLIISMALSDSYSSETAMMAVFSQEQARKGQPLSPGRIEFYVVKGEKDEVIGKRQRVWRPNEEIDGEIDFDYYLESMFHKPLDELFGVLFNHQFEKMGDKIKTQVIKMKAQSIQLNQPAKAIAYSYIKRESLSSVENFFRSGYSRIDPRVTYTNNFFAPRTGGSNQAVNQTVNQTVK